MRANEPRSEARRQALLKLASGTAAFTLAVCLHHFVGMGAVEVLTASAQAVVSDLPP